MVCAVVLLYVASVLDLVGTYPVATRRYVALGVLVPCSAKLLYSLEHPKIAIYIYIPDQSLSKGSRYIYIYSIPKGQYPSIQRVPVPVPYVYQ